MALNQMERLQAEAESLSVWKYCYHVFCGWLELHCGQPLSPQRSLIGSVLLGAAEQLFSFELFKVDVSGWVVLLQLDG